MQLKDFQKALEHKVDLVLPDEPKVFNAAANSGKPLAQTHARAKVCKALRKRSEEHTSELQSLMRISYAVFCLKKKTTRKHCTCNSSTTHNTQTIRNRYG